MEGTDPFTLRKQEKTLNKMKQQKKELKNVENAQKNIKKSKQVKDTKHGKDLKLKNDKKGLEKTLETVQKSTASMGKFDKKLKNEKEINPIKQKKVDPTMLLSRKQERDRNNRILSGILGKK